jgi:site-specific DNA-cytosine methylase
LSNSPRVAALFAGIGGIELGLSEAGFAASVLCEIDEAARKVLQPASHAKTSARLAVSRESLVASRALSTKCFAFSATCASSHNG